MWLPMETSQNTFTLLSTPVQGLPYTGLDYNFLALPSVQSLLITYCLFLSIMKPIAMWAITTALYNSLRNCPHSCRLDITEAAGIWHYVLALEDGNCNHPGLAVHCSTLEDYLPLSSILRHHEIPSLLRHQVVAVAEAAVVVC